MAQAELKCIEKYLNNNYNSTNNDNSKKHNNSINLYASASCWKCGIVRNVGKS